MTARMDVAQRAPQGPLRLVPLAACLGAVLLVAYLSNPTFSATFSPDSLQYAAVASDPLAPEARDRPIGYPAILRLCMISAGASWPRMLVAVQIGLLAGICGLVWCMLRHARFAPWPASLVAAAICSEPFLVMSTRHILADLPLAAAATLAWVLAARLVSTERSTANRRADILLAAAVGAVCGLGALIKPVWLPGGLVLALAVGACLRKERVRAVTVCLVVAGAHMACCLVWIAVLWARFGQTDLSRVGTVNLNMAAIRAGLAGRAPGTPLYRYMERSGVLGEAQSLTWPERDRFRVLLRKLPWEERSDKAFCKRIVVHSLPQYLAVQSPRWIRFFTTPLTGVLDDAIAEVPGRAKHVWVGAWDRLYNPVLPFLFVVGTVVGLRRPDTRRATAVGISLVVYMSLALTMLTYQDRQFARMRICVLPVVLFTVALPLPRRRREVAVQGPPR